MTQLEVNKDVNNIRSTEADFGKYKEIYLSIRPDFQLIEFEEQTLDCLDKLKKWLIGQNLNYGNILNVVSLMRVNDKIDYQKKCSFFIQKITNEFNEEKAKPIFSCIAQAPFQNEIVLEVTLFISQNSEVSYSQKEIDVKFDGVDYNFNYGVLLTAEDKEIIIEGIGMQENLEDIAFQSDGAYSILKQILSAEGMEIKNIVRQWNYIDHIVKVHETEDGKILQNYQIYNEKRGDNYGRKRWKNGYPAATGIGTLAGGIILSARALQIQNENEKIFAMGSPDQYDPHVYSKKVLVGEGSTAPQFERAKVILQNDQNKKIYISGIASTGGGGCKEQSGEDIKFVGDAIQQMQATLSSVELLISKENLQNATVKINDKVTLDNLVKARVYVKFEKDMEKVIGVCEKILPKNLPIQYVVADVCRPDWLVEIEGVALV